MLNLTYYRSKAGLTIRELANTPYGNRKTSNIVTISKIETGKVKKPSLNTLIRLAEVLGEKIGEKIDPTSLTKIYKVL